MYGSVYPNILYILLLICFVVNCYASIGDRTQFFHNCRQNCERQNCSADGIEIQEQAIKYYQQSVFDKTFAWNCADECQYGCMWRTVDAFAERGWDVPQFYGKWPFVRFLGMQEPASVLFSICNLIAHIRALRRFRTEVHPDSPCYKLWHIFSFVCINGWIWSSVFHTRDFPVTELMDYAFAYSIVLVSFYCMVMRMLYRHSLILRGLISLMFLSFFVNYFAYLSLGKFSYSLNMTTNVATGTLSALGWFIWCYFERHRRPNYRKIIRFYILFGMSMSLELLDFPPIFWIIDAHALWHLATVAIISVFYDFIIDDCRSLRKEMQFEFEKLGKQN
ncbi:post-GPI attachment to proteins factor 3 isoform X1 [Bactrocera oleae]|uniref:post-GPI attachment to proteins factor 3 isoform X1 n=1 Tax=Bactrocera oleae TaxID=104688 RepID=UPI0006B7B6A4|nr:post-GPI attachment to proteins factor 3 isoform X1 [Bactrocera oleae]XP_036223774.1 post-GPI attachment to proteins factor 3 isoform X1 [Bactrocera oleae]